MRSESGGHDVGFGWMIATEPNRGNDPDRDRAEEPGDTTPREGKAGPTWPYLAGIVGSSRSGPSVRIEEHRPGRTRQVGKVSSVGHDDSGAAGVLECSAQDRVHVPDRAWAQATHTLRSSVALTSLGEQLGVEVIEILGAQRLETDSAQALLGNRDHAPVAGQRRWLEPGTLPRRATRRGIPRPSASTHERARHSRRCGGWSSVRPLRRASSQTLGAAPLGEALHGTPRPP